MNIYPSFIPRIWEGNIASKRSALQISSSLHSTTLKVRDSPRDFVFLSENLFPWNPKKQNSISTSGTIVGLVAIAGVVLLGTKQRQVPGQGGGQQKLQSNIHGLHMPPSPHSESLRQGPYGRQAGPGIGVVSPMDGSGVVVQANVLWIS